MKTLFIFIAVGVILSMLFFVYSLSYCDDTFSLPDDKAAELERRLSAFQDKDINLDGKE